MSNAIWAVAWLAADEAPNPLEFSIDLAIFSFIIFLGLLFLLGKFAWKPLITALDNREKNIAEKIESAEQAHAKAASTLKQYEQKLAAATDEANQILARARQEASAAKDRIIADANEEAQRQRDRAVADIQAAKNQALRELAERSVDSAIALAGDLVGKEIDRQSHSKLIQDSLNRFAQTA